MYQPPFLLLSQICCNPQNWIVCVCVCIIAWVLTWVLLSHTDVSFFFFNLEIIIISESCSITDDKAIRSVHQHLFTSHTCVHLFPTRKFWPKHSVTQRTSSVLHCSTAPNLDCRTAFNGKESLNRNPIIYTQVRRSDPGWYRSPVESCKLPEIYLILD